MQRALQLAQKGLGFTAPNPMVGALIVHKEKIIGEGFTSPYGGSHAEVNALNQVKDPDLLKEATLYVTLEPCAHTGKTGPCSNRIIQDQLKRVVIGSLDPFKEVNGKGLQLLKEAKIEVLTGVLKEACDASHKRFFSHVNKKRPYIILKWAQSIDGFMDKERKTEEIGINWISNSNSKQWVHRWRGQEQAILIGKNTALTDNPNLTTRETYGKNPLRLIIDKKGELDFSFNLFSSDSPTWVFSQEKKSPKENIRFIAIDFTKNILPQIMDHLYQEQIQSLIVEGGALTLQSFIQENLWDESRVFTGTLLCGKGIKSPEINKKTTNSKKIKSDQLNIYFNV